WTRVSTARTPRPAHLRPVACRKLGVVEEPELADLTPFGQKIRPEDPVPDRKRRAEVVIELAGARRMMEPMQLARAEDDAEDPGTQIDVRVLQEPHHEREHEMRRKRLLADPEQQKHRRLRAVIEQEADRMRAAAVEPIQTLRAVMRRMEPKQPRALVHE